MFTNCFTIRSRLHRFIYERIAIAKKLCSMPHNTPLNRIKHPYENENEVASSPESKGADATKASISKTNKDAVKGHGDFTHFLSTLYAVVDSTCDNSRFEDHCRWIGTPTIFVRLLAAYSS